MFAGSDRCVSNGVNTLALTKGAIKENIAVLVGLLAVALALVKIIGLATDSPWKAAPYAVALVVYLGYTAVGIASRNEGDSA